jgi:hypothetical protein
MKKIVSFMMIVLLLSAISISFAGFEQYAVTDGYYRVNEKARVLQVYGEGVQMIWQWSKGQEWTGVAPRNYADWAFIPQNSAELFSFADADDDDYLHLKKIYYINNYESNFHFRYLGEDPIGDGILYKVVCHWKFSKTTGEVLTPDMFSTPWLVLQAEKNVYMLTEVEPDVWSYEDYMTLEPGRWLVDAPEPPYGFGIVDK